MTIFFSLIPDAAPYLSLIFDSLLDLGGFRGKSTYIQHPGTAEPFRIAPAEPVAYTNLVTAPGALPWVKTNIHDYAVHGIITTISITGLCRVTRVSSSRSLAVEPYFI
jgi:hypothetical protein